MSGRGKKMMPPRQRKPLTSTPENAGSISTMSLEMSTIGRNVSGRPGTIGRLYKSAVGERDSSASTQSLLPTSQEEMEDAYSDYLLAMAANRIADLSLAKTEKEIEEQLGFLYERKRREQEELYRMEQRLADINRLSAETILLDKLEKKLVADLEILEPAAAAMEKIAAAVEPKLNRLRVRNMRIAHDKPEADHFNAALSETADIMQQLAKVTKDQSKMAASVQLAKEIDTTLENVNTTQRRIMNVLPKLEKLTVKKVNIQNMKAQQGQEKDENTTEDS